MRTLALDKDKWDAEAVFAIRGRPRKVQPDGDEGGRPQFAEKGQKKGQANKMIQKQKNKYINRCDY